MRRCGSAFKKCKSAKGAKLRGGGKRDKTIKIFLILWGEVDNIDLVI